MQDQVERRPIRLVMGAPPCSGSVARGSRQLLSQIDGCPRQNSAYRFAHFKFYMEMYSSGRRGVPAKDVGRVTGAEVQILSSPIRESFANIGFAKLFVML